MEVYSEQMLTINSVFVLTKFQVSERMSTKMTTITSTVEPLI